MGESLKPLALALAFALALTSCARPHAPPPLPSAASAPVLAGVKVVLFPVQAGSVPSPVPQQHWPVDRARLTSEIAYWVQQAKAAPGWITPEQIERAIERSPGLNVDPQALAVGVFQRAQVKSIGDPLFGDIRKIAAVFDGQLVVVPVAAEYVGATRDSARLEIATAVIKLDADVLWFGVIASTETGVDSDAVVASAAQAFVTAFAAKKRVGEN